MHEFGWHFYVITLCIGIYYWISIDVNYPLMSFKHRILYIQAKQSLALSRLDEHINCHVVYSCDVFAMAYDIAHVCVTDLD